METYKERYNDRRRKDLFTKIKQVEELIENLFPNLSRNKRMILLSRAAHHHYYKNREIGTEVRMLYDILIKYNYNPYRVYKWFRTSILPEDVKQEVINGSLSRENAMKIHLNRQRSKQASMSWHLMEESRRIIREVLV